jgi:hypothetical protein
VSHKVLSQVEFPFAAQMAIRQLKTANPDSYSRVSEPADDAEVHSIVNGAGHRTGYVAYNENSQGNTVDIGGLAKLPRAGRGVAQAAMDYADTAFPERKQTLDAFDGHLPKLYRGLGFSETGRASWDDQQAPERWNKETQGAPDVVFMSRPPAKIRQRGHLNLSEGM